MAKKRETAPVKGRSRREKADTPPEKRGEPEQIITTRHQDDITALCFFPGNRFIVSGSFDGTVRVFNIRAGLEEACVSTPRQKWRVADLALSRDGVTLAAITEARRETRLNSATVFGMREEVRQRAPAPPLLRNLIGSRCCEFSDAEWRDRDYRGVAASPDRDLVAFGGNAIQLFDSNQLQPDGEPFAKSKCRLLAFLAGRKYLLSGHDNGKVKKWDVNTRKCVCDWQVHEGDVAALVASPDGKLAASADDSSVVCWRTEEEDGDNLIDVEAAGTVALAFVPDHRRLLSLHHTDTGTEIQCWSQETGESLGTWSPDSGQITAFVVSPDGRYVAVARATPTPKYRIEVWETQHFLARL